MKEPALSAWHLSVRWCYVHGGAMELVSRANGSAAGLISSIVFLLFPPLSSSPIYSSEEG